MVTTDKDVSDETLKALTDEQRRQYFDEQARLLLGISGEEFVRRYQAGEWPDPDADPDVMHLVLLLPFAA